MFLNPTCAVSSYGLECSDEIIFLSAHFRPEIFPEISYRFSTANFPGVLVSSLISKTMPVTVGQFPIIPTARRQFFNGPSQH
jgi:hypothetical protein